MHDPAYTPSRRLAICVLLLTGVFGCGGDSAAPVSTLVNHDPDAKGLVSLERLGAGGSYVAGTEERFRARMAGGDAATLRWNASGGALLVQDDELRWTLPMASRATLEARDPAGRVASFDFGLVLNVSVSARGRVDPGPDVTGSYCDLAITGTDVVHLIYRNDTHPGLWYAVWNGAAWTRELVDGMGFDVGAEIDTPMALAVSEAGVPHIAYKQRMRVGPTRIRYATKEAGSWKLEQVDANSYSAEVAIALDPVNSGRPTVFYSYNASGIWTGPAASYRTGVGAWTRSTPVGTATMPDMPFAGGVAFNTSGTATLSVGDDATSAWTWTPAGGMVASTGPTTARSYCTTPPYSPLILDAAQMPLFFHCRGLEHWTGSAWSHSDIEEDDVVSKDMIWGSNGPRIALVHARDVEFVEPDARGFWRYTTIGSSALWRARFGVALDSTGQMHACYGDGTAIMFY